jgi:hypothetical protein
MKKLEREISRATNMQPAKPRQETPTEVLFGSDVKVACFQRDVELAEDAVRCEPFSAEIPEPSKSTRQNREFLWPYQGTLFPDKPSCYQVRHANRRAGPLPPAQFLLTVQYGMANDGGAPRADSESRKALPSKRPRKAAWRQRSLTAESAVD